MVLVPIVLLLTVAGLSPARAQAPPTPPTTKGLLEDILSKLIPPATTAPPPTTVAPPPPAEPAPPPPAPPGPPTTVAGEQVIPPEYLPIINSLRKSGPRNNSALLDALRRLEDLGLTSEEVALLGSGRFPIAGPVSYTDDWHDARFGPPFHLHQGTDIFAARGTPIRAMDDGVVSFTDGGLGGKGAYLNAADGASYYMAHLNGYPRNVSSGQRVKLGDVIGFVGSTGNAEGGSPHLHFEIRPGGGEATNPKPILDRWLDEALAEVPALLASFNVNVPRAITAAGILRRFEGGMGSGSGQTAVAPLLWASSVSAGGGTLRLAEVVAMRMAGRIDWDGRTSLQETQAQSLRDADAVAGAVLGPVTPTAVMRLLGPGLSP